MSSSNCCILTCIQFSQEAGQVVWYSSSFRIFHSLLLIHTVKGSGVVNKAEMDAFLELSCFFDDPEDVDNLTSGSSAFSKTSLNIWKFMAHVLLRAGLENFEHYFTSVWDECNCAVVSLFKCGQFLQGWFIPFDFKDCYHLLLYPWEPFWNLSWCAMEWWWRRNISDKFLRSSSTYVLRILLEA